MIGLANFPELDKYYINDKKNSYFVAVTVNPKDDFIKKNMVEDYRRDIEVESTFLNKDVIIPNW